MSTIPAAAGINAARTMAMNVLRSPWTWIVLAIVAALIAAKHGRRWWQRLTTVDRGNYEGHSQPNAADRARLEALATRMREEIYTMLGWDEREEVAGQILATNDTEVRYIARYYQQIAGGNSLVSDIQGEWSWTGPNKQRLIAKLLQLNL